MCSITRPLAVLLGAIILFAASASGTLAQKRTPLQTIEFPPGYETVAVIAELQPGQCTTRHGHPGIESAYVLEGEAVAKFDSKPDLILKAGRPLQFALEEVHNVCNVSGGPFKAIAHYIVKKDNGLRGYSPNCCHRARSVRLGSFSVRALAECKARHGDERRVF